MFSWCEWGIKVTSAGVQNTWEESSQIQTPKCLFHFYLFEKSVCEKKKCVQLAFHDLYNEFFLLK